VTRAAGIFFIAQERQEAWRRTAAEEVRAMYRRPDAEPLPATGPDPERRRRSLSFHGLLRRMGSAPTHP